MRKQKLFAAVLAGMLTAGLAGCGRQMQTAEKETGVMRLGKTAGAVLESILERDLNQTAVFAAMVQADMEAGPDEISDVGGAQPEEAKPEVPSAGQSKEAQELPSPGQGAQTPQKENLKQEEAPQAEENQPAELPIQEPAPEPVETEQPQQKSIYDYEFDIEAIRQELISIGEGMGLTHVTTDDGRTVTPDNASWAVPVTASESFQGANLERSLKDYVRSMPDVITAYGGNPIETFTIYIEPLGGGRYRIYFLH